MTLTDRLVDPTESFARDQEAESQTSVLVSDLSRRIMAEPAKFGGRPCIRGLRIRVVDVLDLLAAGLTHSEIVEELPDLEIDDIKAALAFAARRVDHP